MATLYTEQSKNNVKTYMLMALFLCVIVALGYFLSLYYGNDSILYIAIVFSILMNIGSYWFADKIALAASRAYPADPEKDRELIRIVENLAITTGLPAPRVYIINDSAPNAFATGRNKNHAAIAVTSGLLSMMDRSELEGVLAHEVSHIGKDIFLSTIVIGLVGVVSIISNIFLRSAFWGGRRSDNEKEGGNILAIIGIIFIILSPIIATLIQLAISRKREFLADATGALITRYPEGLASALKKISSYESPMQHASEATAHLFISSPFGANALKGINKLFMTHPPVEERIKALLGDKDN